MILIVKLLNYMVLMIKLNKIVFRIAFVYREEFMLLLLFHSIMVVHKILVLRVQVRLLLEQLFVVMTITFSLNEMWIILHKWELFMFLLMEFMFLLIMVVGVEPQLLSVIIYWIMLVNSYYLLCMLLNISK